MNGSATTMLAVRPELLSLLATARAARTMPWNPRDADYWLLVFPNMANWLPDDEAQQLRLDFATEMARLAIGPNLRR